MAERLGRGLSRFAGSGKAMTKSNMYYVYFLKSFINSDLYVGSCEDVEVRLRRHNAGRVRSTKGYRPWKLLGTEEYNTRGEAMRMEKFYKNHEQKDILKQRFG